MSDSIKEVPASEKYEAKDFSDEISHLSNDVKVEHDINVVSKFESYSEHNEKDDEEMTHLKEDDFNYEDQDYVEPTEEEMKTLKHVSGYIPLRCWLIAVVELAERFSYYGLSAPFQNYMANGPKDTPPGVLELNSSGATALSYFFQFWCYLTPIFGGYMADTYWGKYNTICVGTGIYVAGIFLLFITSINSITTKSIATGGFIAAIILIGIATGMIKSNISVLIAEQIPKRKARVITLKNGTKVIEDPNITVQNIFMFFYLMINIGSLSVIATTELEHHVGFWAAYLLPFCFFWVAVAVVVLGRKTYIRKPIGDKAISKSFRVLFIVFRNKFNFDAAKPSLNPDMQYPWTDKFVDEIFRALKACKVFVFYPIYWCVYGQMLNNFVTQAGTMELHGLPNDFLQAIDSIAIILFIPIFERFVYPTIRRFTPFRPITKIFFGFMFGSGAMIWAAVLQSYIYKAGPCYSFPMRCNPIYLNVPNEVHIAWQVPAYVLIAISEILASITGLEYAYSNAPESMKAFIMSIFLVTNAFGSALGIAISPTAKNPDFTWAFAGLAIACFIAGCLFWLFFNHYNKTEDAMNAIDFEDEDAITPIDQGKSTSYEIVEPITSMRSIKSL